jgi:hypothetical protein
MPAGSAKTKKPEGGAGLLRDMQKPARGGAGSEAARNAEQPTPREMSVADNIRNAKNVADAAAYLDRLNLSGKALDDLGDALGFPAIKKLAKNKAQKKQFIIGAVVGRRDDIDAMNRL